MYLHSAKKKIISTSYKHTPYSVSVRSDQGFCNISIVISPCLDGLSDRPLPRKDMTQVSIILFEGFLRYGKINTAQHPSARISQ